MSWLLVLRVFGWVKAAGSAVFGLFTRYPLPCALAISVALNAWFYHGKEEAVAGREADRVAYVESQKVADAKWHAAIAAQEAKWKGRADAQKLQYQSDLADARGIADRAIANGRMRLENAIREAGRVATVANATTPGVLAGLPPEAVLVDGPDVQTCTDLYAWALNAHEWATGLNSGK